MPSIENYLKKGPSFLGYINPELGPLFLEISKKILKGAIKEKSEIRLDISELLLKNFTLDGSLIIETDNYFGKKAPKCTLKNVKIINKGIDWKRSK